MREAKAMIQRRGEEDKRAGALFLEGGAAITAKDLNLLQQKRTCCCFLMIACVLALLHSAFCVLSASLSLSP